MNLPGVGDEIIENGIRMVITEVRIETDAEGNLKVERIAKPI